MFFVIVKKREKSVPSDENLTTAMNESGGKVHAVTLSDGGKKVEFTGDVTHSVFANNLARVADGKPTSWEYVWADTDDDAGALDGELAELNGYGIPRARNGQDALGATQYEIDIAMSPETVTALIGGNYSLFGFKAVQANQGGGSPLVWFKISNPGYSTLTQLVWSVQYQAYTSTSKIISGGKVTASNSNDIDLGQTMNVAQGGIGTVVDGGPSAAISINNTTTTPYTCGISQQSADGSDNPMCAFPLYGRQLDVIAPIEKVLLMFSTNPLNTGTVIEQAYSSGVLVDLTISNQRSVSFDINKGWSWGGFNWASSVQASENLVPLLIESPAASAGGLVEARSLVVS